MSFRLAISSQALDDASQTPTVKLGVRTARQQQPTRNPMDLSSAFSPFHATQASKRSPDFPVTDTRPMHSSVAPYVSHPFGLGGYLPADVGAFIPAHQWSEQRESFLRHKFLAYYSGWGQGMYHKDDTEKPSQSYIGLIGKAILSSPQKKLVLSDIYNFILTHHSYFRNKGPGWRNSIRHNLSLNECFIKVGRSPNGKGHFWAINPANYEDFSKGEYRRKRAQRRNRGKAVDGGGKRDPARRQDETKNTPQKLQEPVKPKETANRGFHIDTLLSDCSNQPAKRPAFSFVVPSFVGQPLHLQQQLTPSAPLASAAQLAQDCNRGSDAHRPR